MSLVTSTQKQVIDEAISTYIRNFDRITQQYLTLRQNILGLANEVESQDRTVKIKTYKYELDKIRESYGSHLQGLLMNIDIAELPKSEPELVRVKEQLISKQAQYEENLKDLLDIKKPLVDEIRVIIKALKEALDNRKSKKIKQLVKGGYLDEEEPLNGIDMKMLIFDKEELKKLSSEVQVQDLDFDKYVDGFIETKSTFSRLAGGKYLFDVSRSGQGDRSVEEYDQMIAQEQDAIRDLIKVESSARERWRSNARTLDLMKECKNI